MDKRTERLLQFLDASPSVYHAAANIENELKNAGYSRLNEAEKWELVPGGKYYLTRGGSAVLAFRIPEGNPKGFMMSASHSDHPTFKVKENGELGGNYTRLATEKYGGMIISTWLDRPLSIAGRVLVETEDGIESKLVNIDRDLLLIPNVAIHMNRQVNDGYKWNPAVDTNALLGGKTVAGKLNAVLEEQAGGRIIGHDLYLYARQKATVWGLEDEYICAPALDDLECAWSCTQGFLNAGSSDAIPVLCVFDSEEVGSNSVQGAASMLLQSTLERICAARNLEFGQMLAASFMISADNAHAVHPNHPELADPTNAPVMGGGIVLKFNASQRYTTDGISAAVLRSVCKKAGVAVQTFYNRADMPGGSTLGHISLTHVSVPTADIGLAQLAMHSSCETAAVEDAISLEKAMEVYYSCTMELTENGFCLK